MFCGRAIVSTSTQDQWAQWLLERRHGGDLERHDSVIDALIPVRDQVLDNANPAQGEVLLDVGTGDGLIAFGALPRLGESGRIILSDVSQDLLGQCRSIAQELSVLHQCQFLEASADDLTAIENESVDVVTTRSVLIFVGAKQKAFQEFYRVLKPGGRLSMFEPINRFGYPAPPHMFGVYEGYDVTPVMEIARKVKDVYGRIQPPSDPMLDFDERDLLAFAEEANFEEIHVDVKFEIRPLSPQRWEVFKNSAGNPKVPTLEEAMTQVLMPKGKDVFESHLRPLVESGQGTRRSAASFLWATKL